MVLLAAVLYGLILSIFFPEFSLDGLPALSYFTIQSNILVALFLFCVLIYPPSSKIHVIFRGTVLLSITVTGLVFHIFLVPYYPELFADGVAFRHHLTHTIVPLGFILDWLFFDQKGQMKLGDLKYWLIYPLLYWLFSIVRGGIVGAYPYFFMDLNILDFSAVMLWFLFLVFIFIALGLLLVLADNRR